MMHRQNENQRKVFSILKKVKKSKIKKLTNYLKNEYFHINEGSLLLFDYIKPFHPNFVEFDKEATKKHLFAGKENSGRDLDNDLNDLFNALFKKILDFITLENFLKDTSVQENYLIEYFYQNQFYTWFEKSLIKQKKRLDKQPKRDADFFYRQMLSFDKLYFHPETTKFKQFKSSSGVEDEKALLIKANEYLEISFILTRLRYALELLQRARIFSEPVPDILFLDEIINHARDQQYYENPIIEIYASLVLLAQGKDSLVDFESLIFIFENHADAFGMLERRGVHQFLLNEVSYRSRFCTGAALDQQTAFQLRLYKLGIEKDCLVIFNRMADIVFTNIIITFCKNGAFDFAEKIIKNYQKFLPSPKTLKKEVVRFSWICIFFYREDYLEAIRFLDRKTKFTPLYLEHRARCISLCCEYEVFLLKKGTLKEQDQCLEKIEKAIDSFIRFYERKPQLKNDKTKPYLNFGRILIKVFSARNLSKKSSVSEKKKILDSLKNYHSVAAEKWLLKHIKRL